MKLFRVLACAATILGAPIGMALAPLDAAAEEARKLEAVEVTGVGKTVAEAREDGLRQALQHLVGVYVDAKRRIEIKMTDKQLQQKVEEHVLSYTNAYVDKAEVLGVAEKAGFVEIKLKVTVVVRKLIDRLEALDLPLVGFDTKAATESLTTAVDEREKAYRLYSGLVADFQKLIRFEIRGSRLDLETPATPGSVWLRLEVDFVVDGGQIRRWREAFKLIATEKFVIKGQSVAVDWSNIGRGASKPEQCHFGYTVYSRSYPQKYQDRRGVQALCTVAGRDTDGYTRFNCIGRAFSERDFLAETERLQQVARSKVILGEFLDRNGEIVHSQKIERSTHRHSAHPYATAVTTVPFFHDYNGRAEREMPIFARFCSKQPVSLWLDPRANLLLLPEGETRVSGVMMFQVPEERVKAIAKIRLSLADK